MEKKQIPGWNTRVKKLIGGDTPQFEIWKAAATVDASGDFDLFENAQIRVATGDYAPILRRANEYFRQAKQYGTKALVGVSRFSLST